ncbi:glycine betaine ABC transporter substrate-binding protein [Streptomyces sp. st140]|uniref:glycine betaine ABC transporter substrate-binding protein n=2 Tax=Streptomyces TaxID=1883 RepID=UPI000BF1C808|nr:glycine betaine ABC transporter substrate-binding protein [Streptomyces sp. st140]
MRRTRRKLLLMVVVPVLLLGGCGLKSGSPMVDEVSPGSVGQGEPLKGATLTVTSKNFSENIILGQMTGLVLKAAGAEVLDRTNLPGSISAREAIINGDADVQWDYTGTGWITFLGHAEPIVDPKKQYEAVRDEDKGNGVIWLPPAPLDNTYALAISKKNNAKYQLKTLSDVAALAKKDPGAVTICVENEFASRDDGLPGMEKKYGMKIPAGNIQKMDAGIIYTQVSESTSCLLGEVYTTDGRIKAMNLDLLEDDKHFFPNYNASPVVHEATFEKYPVIAELLDPLARKLTTEVAQTLNAKVDVDGEDPHEVAQEWLVEEGFIEEG